MNRLRGTIEMMDYTDPGGEKSQEHEERVD